MATTGAFDEAIATMPRGGPDASWLDRRFQTDALEYLDRDDVRDEVKQKVIGVLDRTETRTNQHAKYARTALNAVADIPNPRILDATSVANIAAGELGTHPRARTQVIDATAIDAPDNSYDLVVFSLSFHHLPPAVAGRAIAEATRVGKRFLVIDLKRQAPLAMMLFPVLTLPMSLILWPWSWIWPGLHDGFISVLRAYSPSALETLGRAADSDMRIEIVPAPTGLGLPVMAVVFSPSGRGRPSVRAFRDT